MLWTFYLNEKVFFKVREEQAPSACFVWEKLVIEEISPIHWLKWKNWNAFNNY